MKENIDELLKAIGDRMDLVDVTVGSIRKAVTMNSNELIGLGPFIFAYEDTLKVIIGKMKNRISPEERAVIGDDQSAALKIALTHMYLREVQLMRKEKSDKSPDAAFVDAAKKCLYTLHDIPEAGKPLSAEQEDHHLESAMDMSQALKRLEEKK